VTELTKRGNGAPTDEGTSLKVTVVDRRHHAQPGPDDGRAAEGRYPSFVEELKSRAEAAERLAREAAARAHEELETVRARLQRDVERRVWEGKSRLLGSMLEVIDNLDRAVEVAGAESKVVAEGIDLIRRQLLALIGSEGVEPIETLGLEYDPHLAEAVVVEKVDPSRDNIVLEEFQRGYRYGETILRPARVKVGKA